MERQEQFELEQDKLLSTILDARYFSPWKNNSNKTTDLRHDANLEIYITSVCNQKCEYCYLVKYEEIYPHKLLDQNLILNNLRILYDYILEQKFHIPKVEFFTGEIWHTNFGLQVLDITLEYLKKGLDVDWFMIASNCSFIFDSV